MEETGKNRETDENEETNENEEDRSTELNALDVVKSTYLE